VIARDLEQTYRGGAEKSRSGDPVIGESGDRKALPRICAEQKKLPEASKLPKIAEIEKQKPATERGDAEKRQMHQM
jgi:hypothetical protein